jgi:hypothetical protein
LALAVLLILGVILYAYFRPTLELSWFGRTITLF